MVNMNALNIDWKQVLIFQMSNFSLNFVEPSGGQSEIILIDGADEDWFELAMNRTAAGDDGG
jgi:hypothetical protein